jgi:hypothetical protein
MPRQLLCAKVDARPQSLPSTPSRICSPSAGAKVDGSSSPCATACPTSALARSLAATACPLLSAASRSLTEERIGDAKSKTLRERRAKYRYEEKQWQERVEREREELRKQKAAGGDLPMAGLRLPPMLAKAEAEYEQEQRKRRTMPEERMV